MPVPWRSPPEGPTPLLLVPALLSLLAPPQAVAPAPSVNRAAAVFQELRGLVGTWEGTFANGPRHTVNYRLTAGGTVLVETWALAPGRESMTLYHLDGEALVATHYCPQGNQPRLQWVMDGHSTRRSFAFRDGTNLQAKGASHQHAFWVERQGTDTYQRSETYVANGGTAAEAAAEKPEAPVVYRRVEGGPAKP